MRLTPFAIHPAPKQRGLPEDTLVVFATKFRGLNTRLTGVEEAHVVKGILA